ncbi:hypothetical protein, partial [Mesorhizobium sp. M0047]|uniref:hypothetical protein n=1 Tax=Mesorhizobium sp. M0047 TaxID=2956859 RepID=UPI00333970C9
QAQAPQSPHEPDLPPSRPCRLTIHDFALPALKESMSPPTMICKRRFVLGQSRASTSRKMGMTEILSS